MKALGTEMVRANNGEELHATASELNQYAAKPEAALSTDSWRSTV